MRFLLSPLLCLTTLCFSAVVLSTASEAATKDRDPRVEKAITRALDYLAREQRRQGYWEANNSQYKVAMTALAGTALLCEGSTTTRGKYAGNISLAVDYLLDMSQPNGLIGSKEDYRYTYGHGFSMVFLSQVFGEEEDVERREDIRRVLNKAVEFCGYAQTTRGGWGYVSAKDGNDFDEGSTCITQVQGLRACRNAGIPVPKNIIDRAKEYIANCTTPDGGVQYSITRRGGSRPPITAAAVAALFSSGEYKGANVKRMLEYCERSIWPGGRGMRSTFGHWHYAHFYYAQVRYRIGGDKWDRYQREIADEVVRKQSADGAWHEGHIGPAYTTSMNAVILQLDKGFLPIYQR